MVRTDRGMEYPAVVRSVSAGAGAESGRCTLVYNDGKIEAGVPFEEVAVADEQHSSLQAFPQREALAFGAARPVGFDGVSSALATSAVGSEQGQGPAAARSPLI